MWQGLWWLDFKLGIRMLVRYPMLTLVGGLAIAVAIGIGGAFFEFARDLVASELPLPDGGRIVGIQNWDVVRSEPQNRSLHDFESWREQLRSVTDLGASATFQRNLVTADGRSEPITVTEISASAFRVARVPPLLGRSLQDTDERAGAAPVIVIGYDLWQTRFGGDAGVLGRSVLLGATGATVVGVMPKGFAFPMQNHLWAPLLVSLTDVPRLQGPSISVFGRLAPDASLEGAQAELAAIGARAAADFPGTNEHLRPRIMPYTELFFPSAARWQLYLMGSIFVMLLVVACANVATLVFARSTTREAEIAVRFALGATRGRIVGQLFIEALVLSAVAALAGLAAAGWGLKQAMGLFWAVQGPDTRPFWWDDGISSDTLTYVAVLTVASAVISGVLPALKVTGIGIPATLKQAAGRGSSLRLGGVWTAIIVIQVGLTVALLPTAASEAQESMRYGTGGVGVAAEQFLTARIETDSTVQAGAPASASAEVDERFASAYRKFVGQLLSEPGVGAVTFGDRLPGMEHPRRKIKLEDSAILGTDEFEVRAASVDVDLFDGLGVSIVLGRAFRPSDLQSGDVVIVNNSFVQHVLGGRNPVGQRVRYAASGEPDRWYQIVGVAPDLGMNPSDSLKAAGLYHPIAPRSTGSFLAAVRVTGGRERLGPRLRAIAAAVAPTLRLYDVQTLDQVGRTDQIANRLVASTLVLVGFIALLLSTMGIYSLISFTVSQRTREIGIRIALGADPKRILIDILSRALAQLAVGVVAGAVTAVLLLYAGLGDQLSREGPGLLLAVGGVMIGVGILACVQPARRVLRIQPTEALSET